MKKPPEFEIGDEVVVIPKPYEVTEVIFHPGVHGGHYSFALSNGNWYFASEIEKVHRGKEK